MEVFRAFPKDAEDFAGFAKTKLSMPLLVLSGEKAGGPFLIEQGRMVATNVEGVLVKGSGHWLMEEAPDQVIPKLVEFLNQYRTFAAVPSFATAVQKLRASRPLLSPITHA